MEKSINIEVLAPYLPHKLNLFIESDGFLQNEEVLELTSLYPSGVGVYDYNRVEYWYNEVKPVLRPLTDLDKEKDFNGKKIIPLKEIAIYADVYSLKEDILSGFVSVIVFNQLLRWHFDVFGLLDNNLAIDINTIVQ